MTSAAEIQAAGAVVFRAGWDVLVVHRQKYDDWSFPKGKLERGEHPAVAAVREVEEETGLPIRLLRPLASQRYPVRGGRKHVRYWTGRVRDGVSTHDDAVAGYVREGEIDQVAWLPFDVALKQLTYTRDRATLSEALRARKAAATVLVLRHGESWSRGAWHGDDRLRPLVAAGRRQALALAPILGAYGVTRIVSSSSVRCVETVAPYAASAGVPLEETPLLSEEGAAGGGLADLVDAVRWGAGSAGGRGPTVVCSHRPVLPMIAESLGIPDPKLEKGELVVVQLRKGHKGVRSVERVRP